MEIAAEVERGGEAEVERGREKRREVERQRWREAGRGGERWITYSLSCVV